MFNAYIFLDADGLKNKYCLSTFSAEGQKSDSIEFGRDPRDMNSPALTLHNASELPLTGKQLFTFHDGQIISMFTGFPISVLHSPTDHTKKWKLMPDGQIRTSDNFCLTVMKDKTNRFDVTLQKPISKISSSSGQTWQNWRIVTKWEKPNPTARTFTRK